jgi:hypothetical protein
MHVPRKVSHCRQGRGVYLLRLVLAKKCGSWPERKSRPTSRLPTPVRNTSIRWTSATLMRSVRPLSSATSRTTARRMLVHIFRNPSSGPTAIFGRYQPDIISSGHPPPGPRHQGCRHLAAWGASCSRRWVDRGQFALMLRKQRFHHPPRKEWRPGTAVSHAPATSPTRPGPRLCGRPRGRRMRRNGRSSRPERSRQQRYCP